MASHLHETNNFWTDARFQTKQCSTQTITHFVLCFHVEYQSVLSFAYLNQKRDITYLVEGRVFINTYFCTFVVLIYLTNIVHNLVWLSPNPD